MKDISLPTLIQFRKKVYDKEISKLEVILAMKSFSNKKSSGIDCLTIEFYETFLEELQQSFINSLNQVKVRKHWPHPKGKQ